MTGITLWVFVSTLAANGQPLSYEAAYQTAHTSKKPMLILVGADWCPACRTMKQSTLPSLLRDGKLSDVSYTLVDVDASPRISNGLMRSSSIPQLVLCVPLAQGWKRFYLHGGQSSERIEELIRDSLDFQQRDFAAANSNRAAITAEQTANK